MKKLLLAVLAMALCATLCMGVFAAEKVEIKMTVGSSAAYVNGEEIALDAAPIIRNDRTMLPVRFVAEKLGAFVTWDEATGTATILTEEVEIEITINKAEALVNGESVALDSPAFIENNRTYLPVRFIAEKLGATVTWDGETSTATITLGGFVPFPDDYTATYPSGYDYLANDLTPYLTLASYKGLSLSVELPEEVSEDDVKAYIEKEMLENPVIKQITDRAAQNGDSIVVNFVGKIDGVEFDGGTAQNYEITLGAGGFIDGFEEGMVGMKVGETKAVDVVFPVNYGNAELAGKPAVFDITLLSIYEEVPAEYTKEYVKDTFGFDSIKEYEAHVLATLNAERDAEIVTLTSTAVLNDVVANSTFTGAPKGLAEDYMYQSISAAKQSAEQYGMTYEMILMYSGYDIETFENAVRASAESAIKNELTIMSIAKAEGFTATKEECDELYRDILAPYGFESIEAFCAAVGQPAEYLYNAATYEIIAEKVQLFLAENNKFN